MGKVTTLTARECISEAAEALGMGDSEKINKCVDHLCEKFYITGLMAEAIQSLVWQVGYEARESRQESLRLIAATTTANIPPSHRLQYIREMAEKDDNNERTATNETR